MTTNTDSWGKQVKKVVADEVMVQPAVLQGALGMLPGESRYICFGDT